MRGWTSTHRSAGMVPASCQKPGEASRVGSASPRRSRKPWVRAVWSGIACRLVEQSQHSMGLLVMTGLLSHARPGELLHMRHCDLVPPLRGALQNFSGPLARRLVPFWMALRGQSSKNPLWSFTYPTPRRFFQKATTDLTLPPIVPYRWRHPGPSIDTADRSRSLEQVKQRGRWPVMKIFQR